MNPLVARFKKIPPLARALAVGVGFTTLLSLALPAPGRGPGNVTRPPDQAIPQVLPPAPRPAVEPLSLASLVIGREPPILMPGREVVATFVTDDTETCHLVSTARLAAGIDPLQIHWTVAAPAGFIVPVAGKWTGARLDVVLRRPGGNPTGLGGPLSVTIQARVQAQGQEFTARETVTQDKIDQLRQEYIDLARRDLPGRSEFMDAGSFAARYGRRYPWLRFEDLNWSVDPATGGRYAYALARPELVEGLDRVRRIYGGVVINSGYRNPVRQLEVHAPVRESLHQYGYAADLAVTPGGGRALPSEVDWRRLAEVACRAQAKWVEPLDSCAPNSPGCHVHLDYRPGPASSAPVRLRGQVVDAATGKPVSGALVLLGAMPARTDAKGFFVIRNVLSGGPHPVEVRASGYQGLVEPVHLLAWGSASAQLAVHAEDRPSVTVDVARTSWTVNATDRTEKADLRHNAQPLLPTVGRTAGARPVLPTPTAAAPVRPAPANSARATPEPHVPEVKSGPAGDPKDASHPSALPAVPKPPPAAPVPVPHVGDVTSSPAKPEEGEGKASPPSVAAPGEAKPSTGEAKPAGSG